MLFVFPAKLANSVSGVCDHDADTKSANEAHGSRNSILRNPSRAIASGNSDPTLTADSPGITRKNDKTIPNLLTFWINQISRINVPEEAVVSLRLAGSLQEARSRGVRPGA